MIDAKPEIQALNFKQSLTGASGFSASINNELSTINWAGSTRSQSSRADLLPLSARRSVPAVYLVELTKCFDHYLKARSAQSEVWSVLCVVETRPELTAESAVSAAPQNTRHVNL